MAQKQLFLVLECVHYQNGKREKHCKKVFLLNYTSGACQLVSWQLGLRAAVLLLGCQSPPPASVSFPFSPLPVSFVHLILAYNKEHQGIQMQIAEHWGGGGLKLFWKRNMCHPSSLLPDLIPHLASRARKKSRAWWYRIKAHKTHAIWLSLLGGGAGAYWKWIWQSTNVHLAKKSPQLASVQKPRWSRGWQSCSQGSWRKSFVQ